MLSGHVEVDGAYFGGSVRTEDRSRAENQSGKRRVVVRRERGGRTLPFVFRAEDEAVPTIRERVATGTTVYPDEASGWDALHARFDTRRINHSAAFSDDGARTNQAEGFLARLRRAEGASTTTSPASTWVPTPARWRGARTPCAGRTAPRTTSRPARRWAIRCRGCGRDVGSAWCKPDGYRKLLRRPFASLDRRRGGANHVRGGG